MPVDDSLSRDELWRLYDVAIREYHMNTQLGAQRQSFYVGTSVSLATALAS